MERPSFWQSETIGKHVMITKLEKIDGEKFVSFLKSKLSHVKEKDILIFIHGFNVTFANAIRRTAQIAYDLKFKGVPMAYSWPSQGEVSEYMHDESSVQYTVPHLVSFLKKVIDNKGDANIHIIGHSMGTRALTNALKEISYIYSGKHVFKNIILAAPDIDKDVFKESLYPYIIKTTDQITLYASSDDSALKLSMTLHGGERIGQGGDNIFVFKGLDTIDATGIDTSLLGHSYFAEKEILVKDIKDVIQKSLPPTKRKSLIEKIKANLAYWIFKFKNL
jgi:esterase/lipase superfamily enzyme